MKFISPLPAINKVSRTIAFFCLAIFLGLVSVVFIFKNTWIDDHVFRFLSGHIDVARTRFMIFFSFLGKHSFLIPANLLFLAYFLFIKNKKWAIGVAVVSLSSLGLMSLLKNLFQRQRPAETLMDGITNFSFPSGHALMSVAFYGLLAWWMSTIIKIKWLRKIVIALLSVLILLISFSRIYLRVHYTTDCLAGLSLGTAWLILSLAIIDKWQGRDTDIRK